MPKFLLLIVTVTCSLGAVSVHGASLLDDGVLMKPLCQRDTIKIINDFCYPPPPPPPVKCAKDKTSNTVGIDDYSTAPTGTVSFVASQFTRGSFAIFPPAAGTFTVTCKQSASASFASSVAMYSLQPTSDMPIAFDFSTSVGGNYVATGQFAKGAMISFNVNGEVTCDWS